MSKENHDVELKNGNVLHFVREGNAPVTVMENGKEKTVKAGKPDCWELSSEDFEKRLKEKGIKDPKALSKLIDDTRTEALVDVYGAAGPRMKESGLDQKIRIGRPNVFGLVATVDAVRTGRDPRTGEAVTKYGVLGIEAQAANLLKRPEMSAIVESVASDMENAVIKKFGK